MCTYTPSALTYIARWSCSSLVKRLSAELKGDQYSFKCLAVPSPVDIFRIIDNPQAMASTAAGEQKRLLKHALLMISVTECTAYSNPVVVQAALHGQRGGKIGGREEVIIYIMRIGLSFFLALIANYTFLYMSQQVYSDMTACSPYQRDSSSIFCRLTQPVADFNDYYMIFDVVRNCHLHG